MKKTGYTKADLSKMSAEELANLVLMQQAKIENAENTINLLTDQISLMKHQKFGRSSEKIDKNQISFFNEIEDIVDKETPIEPEIDEVVASYKRKTRKKGQRLEDLSNLPVEVIEHTIPEDKLIETLGEDYGRFPDSIYRKLKFKPATFVVEEHHIASYYSKTNGLKMKADHPVELMDNSIVTPSLAAGIMNAKYINSLPLYRIEKEFERYDVILRRNVMAGWMIKLVERYFSFYYDRLKKELLSQKIIHADETPVKVKCDGKKAGSKSYMWVYRSTEESDRKIVLYDYCKTRAAYHLEEYLNDYKGVVVSDGYEAYHKLEKDHNTNIIVAGCWVHCLRKFKDSVKAASGSDKKKSKFLLANTGIEKINLIFQEDNKLKVLPPEERLKHRQNDIRPLVEDFFEWVEIHKDDVTRGSNTGKAFMYALNQKEYLMTFLDYADVPVQNNPAEQSIRNFTIGRKNWQIIDTISGAKSSAILYGMAETAKANKLKPYEYFKYLLEEIPKHMDDKDFNFLERLMPWSEEIQNLCKNEKAK